MEHKIKKSVILLMILLFSFVLLLPASAADGNDELVDADENSISYDESATGTNKIDVELIAKENYGTYGNRGTVLEVHAVDKNGEDVTGGSVLFIDVFGKNYTADVEDGVAYSRIYATDTGKFDIACIYIGTDVYGNCDTTLPLIIPVADTACNNIIATKYDDTVYFTGNVVSDYRPYQDYSDFDDFEEVTEGNVTVYVDGERLGTCSVDINGNYVYIWQTSRNLIGQTINFTGVFTNNQKHFNSSKFSKSFSFPAPSDTKIISEVTVIDDSKKLITGNVVDENGENVIGGTITVNDKYSIPVDDKGKFKFYVTDKTPGKANYEIGVMDWGSKADIRQNIPLMNAIEHTELTDRIIDLCNQGSPYIKFGNGNGKTVVLNVGTHGGELPPQVAGFKLINILADYGDEIDGTIYIFPVLFPESTANNTRIYNLTNLNAIADVDGTISNNLVKFAKDVNASGLGDFHGTRHSDSDVGISCAMCTHIPTPESYLIAKFISDETGCELLEYQVAGDPYAGAVEDYANILGIPSVTCEVLSNHRGVEYGSPELSFSEIRSFLRYFGFDVDEMIDISLDDSAILTLTFESPYNYNPSSMNITLDNKESGNNKESENHAQVCNDSNDNSIKVTVLSARSTGIDISFVILSLLILLSTLPITKVIQNN